MPEPHITDPHISNPHISGADGSDSVETIPNLGPATAAQFARAGITSARALRAMGADEAYRLWLQAGMAPHFIGYYALVMGLQGRPWHDCQGEEKTRLRARFDALKAAGKTSRAAISRDFEAALDALGVVPKGR